MFIVFRDAMVNKTDMFHAFIPLEDRDERLTKILSREKIKDFRNAVHSVKETRG